VLPYQLLADTVLVVHFGVVLFVIGGLLALYVGNLLAWAWVNAWPFRLIHAAAIAVVVAESWLGITCPLTSLESWLRSQAGSRGYSGSFIEYWIQQLLFYEAPSWVFATGYTVYGLLVAAAWWRFPPEGGKAKV